jgi:broad specificity phosphatase PhoE
MRLFILSRHGESTMNVESRLNGDPSIPVALTRAGREAAARLGAQVAPVPIDVCIHTRFVRTRETAEIALAGRPVPFEVESLLDDIGVGDLDGCSLDDYRAWKHAHTRQDAFPGGESLDDAARRYVRAFRALVARSEQVVLVVCHEIPLRYALNAAVGSGDLDAPLHAVANATPYLFDEESLARAASRIESLVGGAQGT